jgi:hypothetical protein
MLPHRILAASAALLTLTLTAQPLLAEPQPKLRKHAAYCIKRWHAAKRPPAAKTRICARYFLMRTYERNDLDGAMDHDPPVTAGMLLRFSAAQLAHMEAHVKRLCGKGGCDISKQRLLSRAQELFIGAGAELWGTHDNVGGGGVGPNIAPQLKRIAKGERLPKDSVSGLSVIALWKLRNAPYARHGRRFKNKDLDNFFFAKRKGKRASVLPFRRNPAFKPKMLTAADRANIKLLGTIERKKRRKVKRWSAKDNLNYTS